jgi:acylphosphatase
MPGRPPSSQQGLQRVRARVRGRVQGVFYRASTCDRAAELGLVGWVRNCADGSVELEAEGPRERVDELIAWCRRGPTGARVTGVEIEELSETRGDRAFCVRG